MKKNLWFIVAFVFLSFAQLGAMDPPKIILPEWYSCDGEEIYTFDGEIFYEKKTGNVFIVIVGQEKLTLFGVKPAYYESDNGELYSYNDGVTFYNYEGKKCDNAGHEVLISNSSPEKNKNNSWQASKTRSSPGQNRAKLNLRLKEKVNQPVNIDSISFKVLAEADESKENELVSALRAGCQTLIIEVNDKSLNLNWIAGVFTLEILNDLKHIIIRKQNETDKMPGIIEFVAFTEMLKANKYAGKLEVRVIKHSSEVAAFYDLAKKTEIDLVFEGYFNSSDMAGLVVAINEARNWAPKRKNIRLRLLKSTDEYASALETFKSVASLFKIEPFLDDSVAFTAIQFGLKKKRRTSDKRAGFGISGRQRSSPVIKRETIHNNEP